MKQRFYTVGDIVMTKIIEITDQRALVLHGSAARPQLTPEEFAKVMIPLEVTNGCFTHVAVKQSNIETANRLSCPRRQIYVVHMAPET